MGFLKKLFSSVLGGGGEDEGDIHREYVRCSRCGEKIPVRVDLRNELTPQYDEGEGAYYVRKGVLGSGENYCFQKVEILIVTCSDLKHICPFTDLLDLINRHDFSDIRQTGIFSNLI